MDASQQLAEQALDATSSKDEVAQSEKIAETLNALQGVIERNARELGQLNKQLKEKREMLKNMVDNDTEVSAAAEKVKLQRDRKSVV